MNTYTLTVELDHPDHCFGCPCLDSNEPKCNALGAILKWVTYVATPEITKHRLSRSQYCPLKTE